MTSEELKDEYNNLLFALSQLVEIKKYKDKYGKDEWYESNQPEAWRFAFKLVNQLKYEV